MPSQTDTAMFRPSAHSADEPSFQRSSASQFPELPQLSARPSRSNAVTCSPGRLQAIARTGVGNPFLRNHEQGELMSAGGA